LVQPARIGRHLGGPLRVERRLPEDHARQRDRARDDVRPQDEPYALQGPAGAAAERVAGRREPVAVTRRPTTLRQTVGAEVVDGVEGTAGWSPNSGRQSRRSSTAGAGGPAMSPARAGRVHAGPRSLWSTSRRAATGGSTCRGSNRGAAAARARACFAHGWVSERRTERVEAPQPWASRKRGSLQQGRLVRRRALTLALSQGERGRGRCRFARPGGLK